MLGWGPLQRVCRACTLSFSPPRRQTTIKRGDYRGWAREYGICLLHQLNPRPLAHEDVRLMRASFMLTHRVPAGCVCVVVVVAVGGGPGASGVAMH